MPPDLFAYAPPTLRSRAVSVGDRLLLGKPLGSGVYLRARSEIGLGAADEVLLAAQAADDNAAASALLDCLFGTHAQVEVGELGLVDALCRLLALAPTEAGPLAVEIEMQRLPILPSALALSARFGSDRGSPLPFEFAAGVAADASWRSLLLDAEPHGGLLVACAPERMTEVLACFLQAGFAQAVAIGSVRAGATALRLR